MVIEHEFVTTLAVEETIARAMEFLAARGFVRPEPAGWGSSAPADALEMRRGKANAARAASIVELPQAAHVQFDRGRVSVVLTIEPSAIWGGQTATGIRLGPALENPKAMRVHNRMLAAIATGLEQLLVQRAAPEIAARPWQEAEAEALRLARRRKLFARGSLGLLLVLFAGLLLLLATTGG